MGEIADNFYLDSVAFNRALKAHWTSHQIKEN